jgi:hypothetical protein
MQLNLTLWTLYAATGATPVSPARYCTAPFVGVCLCVCFCLLCVECCVCVCVRCVGGVLHCGIFPFLSLSHFSCGVYRLFGSAELCIAVGTASLLSCTVFIVLSGLRTGAVN